MKKIKLLALLIVGICTVCISTMAIAGCGSKVSGTEYVISGYEDYDEYDSTVLPTRTIVEAGEAGRQMYNMLSLQITNKMVIFSDGTYEYYEDCVSEHINQSQKWSGTYTLAGDVYTFAAPTDYEPISCTLSEQWASYPFAKDVMETTKEEGIAEFSECTATVSGTTITYTLK